MDEIQLLDEGQRVSKEDAPIALASGMSRREFLLSGGAVTGLAAATFWAKAGVPRDLQYLWQGMTPDVDDVSVSDLAVDVYPGDSIQPLVDAHPENTVFRLRGTDRDGVPGVHRLQQIVPKNGQHFVGERGPDGRRLTVMNGATILPAAQWVPDGNYYRFDEAPLQPPHRVLGGSGLSFNPGEGKMKADSHAASTRPEDLYITTDGECQFLRRVKDKSEVVGGKTWFFDEHNRFQLLQPWPDGQQLSVLAYEWDGDQMITKGGGNTGEGNGALAWLMADVDGDGLKELLQPWDDGGLLAVIVYNWDRNRRQMKKLGGGTTREGSGALTWLVGDVDGDGRDELIQPWHNRENDHLGLVLYEWTGQQMTWKWASEDLGESPSALAWLMADIDDDGKQELLQVWDNGVVPGLLIYRWLDGRMQRVWSGNLEFDGSTRKWLIADVDGDGKAELLQVYRKQSRLSLLLYGWDGQAMTKRFGGILEKGYVDLRWRDYLVADVDGDEKDELVLVAADDGDQLSLFTFHWETVEGSMGLENDLAKGQVDGPPDALAWLVGDIDDDGMVEVLEPWRNEKNGRLGLHIYSWQADPEDANPPNGIKRKRMLKKWSSRNMGQGAGALTWLAANIDTGPRKIYVHKNDNPLASNRTIELSLAKFAFGYHVDWPGRYLPDWPLGKDPRDIADHPDIYDPQDKYASKPAQVVVRDLVIEKYACPAQTGAIGYFRPGNDWIITNNEVRFCHGEGIKFKGKAVVRGNYVHHNGQFGIQAGDGERTSSYWNPNRALRLEEWGFNGGYAGAGAVVEDNLIEANNYLSFDPGWGAGGTKFSQCYDLLLRNNVVIDNNGAGLWCDFSYSGIIYEGNVVVGNGGQGIFHETGFKAIIRNNTVIGNMHFGADEPGTGAYFSQVFIAASSDVEIANNRILIPNPSANYQHGIIVIQFAQWPEKTRTIEEYPVYCRNIFVHHNTVIGQAVDAGLNGAHDWYSEPNDFYTTGNIDFAHNEYHYPDPDGDHWLWKDTEGPMTFKAFKTTFTNEGTVDQDTQSNVLAAGKDGHLYRYNGTGFERIQGLGVSVEGGLPNRGFHVNRVGQVWQLTKQFGWVRLPGCRAQDVAASSDGQTIYACGKNEYLYKFDHALNRFTRIQGLGTRIAVDDNGRAWHVNSHGWVYRQDAVAGWVRVYGCRAVRDIGCGGGRVYACGRDQRLYRFNPGTELFEEIQGLGVRIAVGPDGTAWHVNRKGMVWRNTPDRGWVRVHGCRARDIGL
ncbi:MAG: right-handed parallel beta-helix repeat-containing protein [Chloroflexota bacterium]